MIVADVLGPWHDVEATDGEGRTYRDRRRLPQFVHDAGITTWRDVTAQAAERIPPTPGLGVWRVWCSEAQLAQLVDLPAYQVLRSGDVGTPHADPGEWPVRAAEPETGDAAFPALPDAGWLEANKVYLYDGQAYRVRKAHERTIYPPSETLALFVVWRADAESVVPWIAGESVLKGYKRTYEDKIYECTMAHVTQVDYTPDRTLGVLWKVLQEPGETPQPWVPGVYDLSDPPLRVAPAGSIGLWHKNDRAEHQGAVWVCQFNNNAYAPGVWGWVRE